MKKLYLSFAIILAFVLRLQSYDGTSLGIVFGVGSIFGIWFLVRSMPAELPFFPEICALFFAISPWHIFITKYQDISFLIFFMILGVNILLRIFKKHSFLTTAVFLLITIFFIANPLKDVLKGFSNTQVPIWTTDEQRREHGIYFNNPFVVLIHNKVINYALSFVEHYGRHFQGDFLFITGDVRNEDGVKDFGQMYLFDLVFILTGVFFILKNIKQWAILIVWLLFSPFPSALDFQPPNAIKAANMIVPLTILSGYGAVKLFNLIYHKFHKSTLRYLLIALVMLFTVWDFSRFLHQYFVH